MMHARVNPPVAATTVGTMTLKLQSPLDRWQNVVEHLASLPSMALTTYRIGKEAFFFTA
jgi:hypothetical protein